MNLKIVAAIAAPLLLGVYSCTTSYTEKLENIKDHAEVEFAKSGFMVTGYSGYQVSFDCLGPYVWYTLERPGKPSTVFKAALCQWGDEFHIYNLTAIDAVKGGL